MKIDPDHKKAKAIRRVSQSAFHHCLLGLGLGVTDRVCFLKLIVIQQKPTCFHVFRFKQKAKLLKSTKDDGNEAYKTGDFEKAYELYSKALEIDPNNLSTCAKLYYNRGVVASKV